MTQIKGLRAISSVLLSALVFMSSCQKDEENQISALDRNDLSEDAIVESLFQDMDDMARAAISAPADNQYNGGRISTTITINDHRFDCDGVNVTLEILEDSTPEHPKGIITVDFGTSGCADLINRIRKGKIIFTYNGRRFESGSTVITTTDNYFVNDVKLEGTRTLTNITENPTDHPRFNAVLTGGKAIFKDQTQATRESDITWTWVKINQLQYELVVNEGSSANGTTRAGRDYEVVVLEDLHYKRACFFAVSGIKQYTVNGDRIITVDYGSGECDNSITVTTDGVTRTITVQG